MSKRLIVPSGLACLLAACANSPKPVEATPADPAAERWQAYEHAESAYYQLDKQDFSQLSCHVDVPVADKFVQQVHATLARVADKVDFTDTLANYRLTYSKAGGLHMDDPTIAVTVKPGVQVPDSARMEKGREQMLDGFSHLIAGIDAEISGMVSLLESGNPKEIDVQSVRETADGYEASLLDKRSSTTISSVRSGLSLTSKMTTASEETDSTETLAALPGGKLVPKTLVIDSRQGQMVHTHISVALDYQPVGSETFPSRIAVQVNMQSLNASQTNAAFEIDLSNCTLNK